MNFISRIIKSINAMRERLKIERHEAMYGPHFNEECALKAVSKYDYDEDDEYLDREREEERMHRYEPMYERRISRY